MLESIGSAISAIKNSGPKLYAAALVGTSLLLFLPDGTLAQLGAAEFKVTYRQEIGGTFIVSLSLLVAHGLFAIAQGPLRWLRNRRFERDAIHTLSNLTSDEKDFLSPFILNGDNSRHASYYDGIVNGLVAKQILYRASNMSVPGSFEILFPYNLQPYARKLLTENPALLS